MKCPACGSEVAAARFCENCGAALPTAEAQPTQPAEVVAPLETPPVADVSGVDVMAGETGPVNASATQPVAQPATQPVTQPVAQPAATPPNAASPYTPQPAQQMPNGAYQPPAGTYQPPAGAPAPAPYAPAAQQATVSSTAFVLAIIGLILAVTGIGVIIGLVLCIVALVLNAKNNKSGLANPHKTSTTVISVIGLVVSALVLVTSLLLGALLAEVYAELEAGDFDLDRIEFTVDEDTGEISISEKQESGAGQAAGSTTAAPAASADARYFDSQNNPTLFALVELTGQQFVDEIEAAGFEYDDDIVMWSAPTGAFFYAEDADDDLTRSQTVALGAGGTGSAVEYNVWVTDYRTPQAALSALSSGVTVLDTATGDEDFSALRIANTAGNQFIAIAYDMDDGDQLICLFPETAVTAGLFADELLFDNATTMDAAWSSLKSAL